MRNPVQLATALGQRIRLHRLAMGWTQEELADRAGIATSTLRLLESSGRGSLQRLVRVAIALGIDGELRELFAQGTNLPSIEAAQQQDRQRAPRRRPNPKGDGA